MNNYTIDLYTLEDDELYNDNELPISMDLYYKTENTETLISGYGFSVPYTIENGEAKLAYPNKEAFEMAVDSFHQHLCSIFKTIPDSRMMFIQSVIKMRKETMLACVVDLILNAFVYPILEPEGKEYILLSIKKPTLQFVK